MSRSFSKENEILLSKRDKKYRVTFEIENEGKMIVKAGREDENVLIPCTYQTVLTTNEIPLREDVIIHNMPTVLKGIISLSRKNRLKFSVTKRYIKLYYILYQQQQQLIIPLLNKNNLSAQRKNSQNNEQIVKGFFVLSELKIIKSIKQGSNLLICELKDKRLVTSTRGPEPVIVVYNHSYEPQIKIYIGYHNSIFSLYALRNGDLASVSKDKTIKIWRINENDYQFIHTLKGHTDIIWKVIELEDGKIASCSKDLTIIIWDNTTYQSIITITGHTDMISSIIEMNDSIISASTGKDKTLRKWKKSTYECVKIVQGVFCKWPNALEKLNNKKLVLGDYNVIFNVDIESSKIEVLEDNTLGIVKFLRVIRGDLVLFGNEKGEVCQYNAFYNFIISKIKVDNGILRYLYESQDNKLIFYCRDSIKICEYTISTGYGRHKSGNYI